MGTTTKTDAAAPIEKNFEAKWGRTIAASGYSQIPDALILNQKRLGLSPLDVCILLVLLKYGHPKKPSWPAKATVAGVLGIDASTVRKRIASLQQRGFVLRVERKHRLRDSDTNLYQLEGLAEKLVPYAQAIVDERQMKKAATAPKKPGVRPTLHVVRK